MGERLQRFIARSTGIARRKAEQHIADGNVTVNSSTVTTLGTVVDPTKDVICLHGKRIQPLRLRTVLLHKPPGYVCTRAQHRGEKTVYELIPNSRDLVIAGRLDKDSEGLVLLTNDGDLVNTLTHPRYRHEKEYRVTTKRPVTDADIASLTRGIRLEEGIARADRVIRETSITVRLVLHQGWKRQIRRMFETRHHVVRRLQRIRMGQFTLGTLAPGEYQEQS